MPYTAPIQPITLPFNIGTASPYVILSVGTLTNGVHDQLVTGNTGHVGTLTDTFTYDSGADVAGATILGTVSTPFTPVGDARIARDLLLAKTPTFSYPAGAVDLATDVNTPDGIGVFKTGIYKITGACNIGASGITLTGLGTFIFIITGALDTTAASVITLADGATSGDAYFVPGGAVTLAAATTFKGTILAGNNAITTGAVFNLGGRLISEGAITLGGGVNTFTVPLLTSSGGGHTIEDEGVPVAPQTVMNFVGAGVSAADSGGKTVVTITSGLTQAEVLNLTTLKIL